MLGTRIGPFEQDELEDLGADHCGDHRTGCEQRQAGAAARECDRGDQEVTRTSEPTLTTPRNSFAWSARRSEITCWPANAYSSSFWPQYVRTTSR